MNQQQKAIAKKQDELRSTIQANKGDEVRPGVEQILAEVGALDKWQSHKVNWLEELTWISEKMLTPDDIQVTRFQGTDTGKGFRVTLDSKMTKEKSSETSWKQLFSGRYDFQFDGVPRTTAEDATFPVARKFKLTRNADLEDTIDQVSLIIEQNLDEMYEDSEQEEEAGDSTETGGTNEITKSAVGE